jgi:putative acetyltransferase
MKRLYVGKAFRGSGLGRQLAEAILDAARLCRLRLRAAGHTGATWRPARALYEDLGFEEIPPYYHSPIVGAHYLKADL